MNHWQRIRCALLMLVALASLSMPSPVSAEPVLGTTVRASVASDGNQGNAASTTAALSANGRYVAFVSAASNLVTGDTNTFNDIFVRDTKTGTTSRVSVATDGTEGNGNSLNPAISGDGRFVAFSSSASNLVAEDTTLTDLFLHDRQTGTTSWVANRANGGTGRTSLSADGRYVAFSSDAADLVTEDTNGEEDIFVYDNQDGTLDRVSLSSAVPGQQAQGPSFDPALSADGRYVAFQSEAANLVAGDTNADSDVFVHDRQTATTTRSSVGMDETQPLLGGVGAAISADGRYVSFSSTFRFANSIEFISRVFVHDRETGETSLVSVSDDGTAADRDSDRAGISDDGRFVAFLSNAFNLVPDDTNEGMDVFVHDRQTGTTTRASVATGGAEATGGSSPRGAPDLSADGRYIAFDHRATNLVVGDTNGVSDVFLRDVEGVPGDPEPAPSVLAIGDALVHEGDQGSRTAVVNVSLSEPAATMVTVDYATRDGGNATAPGDYTAKSGTLTFAPGVVNLKIKVPVLGDLEDEGLLGHIAFIDLTRVTGPAAIGDFVGQVTIWDDDPPAVTGRRLAIGDATVREGDTDTRAAVFTVSLSKPSNQTITVDYATVNDSATKPVDYGGTRGTLRFPAGTTSLPVKVVINSDTAPEGASERFFLKLSNVTTGTVLTDDTGQGLITDDD